jgi:transposase
MSSGGRISHYFENQPKHRLGRPRSCPRAVLNGILWVLINSEKWKNLPPSYPASQTCYLKWLDWKRIGLIAKVLLELGIAGDFGVRMTRR